MHSSYFRWEQPKQQHRNLSPLRQQHLHRQLVGPAAVEKQEIPESSVASVEHPSLWQKDGPVPAVQ